MLLHTLRLVCLALQKQSLFAKALVTHRLSVSRGTSHLPMTRHFPSPAIDKTVGLAVTRKHNLAEAMRDLMGTSVNPHKLPH